MIPLDVLPREEQTPTDRPAEPEASRAPGPDGPGTAMTTGVGWSLVALLVGFAGEQVWSGSNDVPGANLAAVALIATGLTALWLIWTRRGAVPRWMQLGLLAALGIAVGFQAVIQWLYDPSYGTDAVAFDQYAAMLALHGSNPYVHSMAPSFAMFHVPAIFHTYRLDGTTVDALSYPAGSFLPYLPLLAAGVTVQAANIVDLAFWIGAMVLLWRLLPREIGWAAGVIGAATVYVGFIIGGLNDALFVPFVLVAAYRWDRFVDPDVSWWRRWAGPLALGAAMSVKQTPWFLAPYLLVALWLEARARGLRPGPVVLRYAGAAGAVFLSVNLPYVLADPRAWATGALVPFLDPTIPDGQGLINLAVFHGIGGGDLRWYTLLGMGFVLLGLAALALRYDALKRAWVPLVALSFYLPTRSFGSYLFMLVPAALVAATTVGPAPPLRRPRVERWRRAVLSVGVVATLAVAAVALTRREPLEISVLGTRSTGQLQTLDEVTVRVTNRTARTVHPHFTINAADHATTFWYVLARNGARDVAVPPHRSVTVTLQAPNTASMPGLTAPLTVEAFTARPASVSVSHRYLLSPVGTSIVPEAVDAPVPVGRAVRLTVQAENRYGLPVHRAGIPIVLNQTVYGQSGFFAGESSINGHPEGLSPVTMRTDASGRCTFVVVGVQPQSAPVYYQAWIDDGATPYGYSNQLSVHYIAAS